MKNTLLILVLITLATLTFGQHKLSGAMEVWNGPDKDISLMDDFFYQLSPGDVLEVEISGLANINPYDEQRKGGGFLGLFKKSYTVRIDNWKKAGEVNVVMKVGTFGTITFAPDAEKKILNGNFTIPQDPANPKLDLLDQCKISAFINEQMSPLRAGQYNVKVTVDSKARIEMLRSYFKSSPVQGLHILNFEDDIRPFIENGKLVYKHPDETVKAVEDELGGKPNITAIRKDLYRYLLNFAPNNTTVRARLAGVFLEELNFPEAQVQAKKTIQILSKKDPKDLTPGELIDYGRSYEILAGVSELRELGLQENAYSVGAIFYGEAAGWFSKAAAKDAIARATLNQVRCLQKIGTLHSLLQAAAILEAFNESNPTN